MSAALVFIALLSFDLNYGYITLDRFGGDSSSSGFMTRVFMVLE